MKKLIFSLLAMAFVTVLSSCDGQSATVSSENDSTVVDSVLVDSVVVDSLVVDSTVVLD